MNRRVRALASPSWSGCVTSTDRAGRSRRWLWTGLTYLALLCHVCLAGTAPMTRWCPCCRAVAQCPRWWWKKGSSHSPAVRPACLLASLSQSAGLCSSHRPAASLPRAASRWRYGAPVHRVQKPLWALPPSLSPAEGSSAPPNAWHSQLRSH